MILLMKNKARCTNRETADGHYEGGPSKNTPVRKARTRCAQCWKRQNRYQ